MRAYNEQSKQKVDTSREGNRLGEEFIKELKKRQKLNEEVKK